MVPNDNLLASARKIVFSDRLDEAATELEKVFSTKGETVETHHLLGLIALRKGNHATAKAQFDCALKLQSSCSEILALLAQVHYNENDWDVAATRAQESLTCGLSGPARCEILALQGLALLLLDRQEESAASFRALIPLWSSEDLAGSIKTQKPSIEFLSYLVTEDIPQTRKYFRKLFPETDRPIEISRVESTNAWCQRTGMPFNVVRKAGQISLTPPSRIVDAKADQSSAKNSPKAAC